MIISLDQLYDYGKFIPPIVAVGAFAWNILKRLYKLNVSVEKVLDQQTGQLSMHKGLQEALNEIKSIKLVCNERHRWDGRNRRNNELIQ